ncbi:srg family chemoreceptor domain-containing protein [Ditylenchus destructor]|uniref:Serpentine receptor class gamma n=1 Tax=Ditylenchus destructor TaxID=166010 RepID=A0AAD4MV17_9BILA|nr:srg family chemoreceptor domain-containing protein [Ditylenchus destructor]
MSPEAWTWLQLGVESPFVLFHISVLWLISRSISRKDPNFKTYFYTLYCYSSVADLGSYVASIFTFRLARIGMTPKVILDFPVGNLVMFFARYCSYFQFVAHTAIAINRYYAIAHPVNGIKFKKWQKTAIYLLLFLLPIPGAATRLLGKMEAKPTLVPNVFVVAYNAAWITVAGSTAYTVYSTIASAVSIGFELRTFVIYYSMNLDIRRNRRDDYRLLVYAVTQFVTQFLLTLQQIAQALTASMGLNELRSSVQEFYPYLNDLLCLSAPVCLVISSRAFRRRYLEAFGLYHKKMRVTPVSTRVSHTTNITSLKQS